MFGKITNETIVSVHKPVEFPVIDHDELVLQLDVEALSKQSARENKPLSNSNSPDANELKFREHLSRKGFQSANKVKQSLSDLRDSILNTSIAKETSEVDQMTSKFERQISSNLPSKLSHLKHLEDDYRQSNDDLNHFKKSNSLRRTATYPDSHTLTISFLFLALIAESMLNGVFFAEGSDSGLIGGIAIAMVISLFNILFGFSTGLFILRYKNHISRVISIFSYIGLILALALSFVFNLLVGHYREALGIDPDNAQSVAVDNFVNGIMTIHDVQSWLLIAIGLCFFGFAIFKGYKFDDEYPKYGKIYRSREAIKEEINSVKENIYDEFDELHIEFDNKLEEIYEDVKMISRRLNSHVNAIENQESIYRTYSTHLQNCSDYVVKLYRDINVHERESAPPEYFNQINMKLDLNDDFMVGFVDSRNDIIDKKDHLATTIPKIKSELLVIKEKYHSKINEACRL
jgi:gas vesicle protein